MCIRDRYQRRVRGEHPPTHPSIGSSSAEVMWSSRGYQEWLRSTAEPVVDHWLQDGNWDPPIPRDFEHSKHRVRMDWDARVKSLSDREFQRTYRLSKKLFEEVLAAIRPTLTRPSSKKARIDLHGPVLPELQLSMTLRFLAGGSYLDIYQMHGVGASTMYSTCLLYTSPSPRDRTRSRMPSSA
eukprot:TRINITY_DN4410_c0_g1_i4.p1 TRINITY_DN4410_c0_g1~~TRINITY_DN4410_c0_g1_i4.p1  ORF type:complete len:183 (-),score=34.49 TRINITY_DN4410_c0_g1_i4:69-617(-)